MQRGDEVDRCLLADWGALWQVQGGEVPAGVQEFPRVERMPVFHAARR